MTGNFQSETSLVPSVCPLGIGQSELVLQDDAGNTSVSDFEEISNYSNGIANPDFAGINIEHSSDVVIGPVTHFNGPVTIYQNVNGPQEVTNVSREPIGSVQFSSENPPKLAKSESTEYSPVDVQIKKPNKYLKYTKYFGVASVLLLILISVIIYFMVSGPPPPKDSEKDDTQTGIEPPFDTYVGKHRLIYRKEWGGRPIIQNKTVPLIHPTPLVIIAHTAGTFCSSFEDCSTKIRAIQSYHVSKGSPDVGYNFMIGGDASIYVTRGWDLTNFLMDNTISISFLGNYVYDELTPDMIDATKLLLEEGVKQGKLSKEYKLVAHNQTFATLSPGDNVYKEIKNFPHFFNERINNNK